VQNMVGRLQSDLFGGQRAAPPEARGADGVHPALRVEGLTADGEFSGISFSVRPREILGMAGLVGSGRTEIAKAIFGAIPHSGGRVWVDGREVRIKDPAQMIGEGVVYVPEDREVEGLIADLSVADNMLLPAVVKFARAGFVNAAKENEVFSRYTEQFQIKTPGPRIRISSLSGGNRQKVVLSKWMAMSPRVFIFDEPTHGIDVGSKAQVHRVIRELAAQGLGIILISSDLPEVLEMSDRVLVISDGLLVADFPRRDATQEKIMAAAVAGKKKKGAQ